ncbi:hypothetical protein C8J56DRAFT_340334 [Mycena floridula]|nr:hypothetical protein C8J56DRAFT_340334 [Mycena floridula]
MSWNPKRSLSETEALLTGPGSIHEVETRLIDGRLLKTYKHLWPNTRAFWTEAVSRHSEKTYIVFDDQRLSYLQVHQQVIKAASLLRNIYRISKGDRVGICSRNCPEYLVVFWACQLLGAVPVLANAWLPLESLRFCLVHTQCKVVIVDSERADKLEPIVSSLLVDLATKEILVFTEEVKRSWRGMVHYRQAMNEYPGKVEIPGCDICPEDNAVIMFTSGTTGLPKGVLSTHRQFLTNALNTIVGNRRAAYRKGEEPEEPSLDAPQRGALLPTPLFHVTGLTSYTMLSTMIGLKIILMRKWIPAEAARLIREENVFVAGGVPAMVSDLISEPSLVGYGLESLFFGGSPAPDMLPLKATKMFPKARLSQGYGLTETNSIAVAIAGEDYMTRPHTVGLPSPVNEIAIMDGDLSVPAGRSGEVWLRGPNVMRAYWADPEATRKAITADGWLKTGDIGYLDIDGFLYIKDRIKDIIIRGGENIDSIAVENALYADPRVLEAAAVGVPDARLGELVVGVVNVKQAFRGRVLEASLISEVQERLPRYAVPVMIVIVDRPFELTPSGKIMKTELRELARKRWQERLAQGGERQPRANL